MKITESQIEVVTLVDNNKYQVLNKSSFKYNIAFLICGLVNNSGYVMVGTAAQDIAHQFKKDSYMGSFNLSLIFFSIFIVMMNANFLINFPHKIRMQYILLLSLISYVILGICTSVDYSWAFYLALVGSTLQGCACTLGEVTMIGYIKNFSPDLIGFWGSGTGSAGLFGSGMYIGLLAINVPKLFIFLSLVPFLGLYWLSFLWLEKQRSKQDLSKVLNDSQNSSESHYKEKEEVIDNEQMNFSNARKVLINHTGFFSLNLGLVYFLEYSCIVCWADRANPKTDIEQDFIHKNAFAILGFSYQTGVLISRSSLQCFKIKKVHILTFVQLRNITLQILVNTLFWIYIAINKNVEIQVQILLMIFVGFMGGACYVNVYYMIVSSTTIPKPIIELSLNINSITNNIGVLAATLTTLAVDNIWK